MSKQAGPEDSILVRDDYLMRGVSVEEAVQKVCEYFSHGGRWRMKGVDISEPAKTLMFSVRDLQSRNARLYKALEELYELQDDPPLLKYRAEWQSAMAVARELLEEDHDDT